MDITQQSQMILIIPSPGQADGMESIINLVLDSVASPHTKRAYRRALRDFIEWFREQDQPFAKATVHRYRASLIERELGAANINQRLQAIRKLAREAADNGLFDERLANGISRVKGVPQKGRRLGNWLNSEDANALINAPNAQTGKGVRDRAMLAVMVGCGLRRSEVASVTWEQVKKRQGRWLFLNIRGKGGRVRSVVIPRWVKVTLDEWRKYAAKYGKDKTKGGIFRTLNRWHQVQENAVSVDTVLDVVRLYGGMIGEPELAPHDLRRTCARLAYQGGAKIKQIQLMLGHASVQTTERYLGLEQDFDNAPNDLIKVTLV